MNDNERNCGNCGNSCVWGLHTAYCSVNQDDVNVNAEPCSAYITLAEKVERQIIERAGKYKNTDTDIMLDVNMRRLNNADSREVLSNIVDKIQNRTKSTTFKFGDTKLQELALRLESLKAAMGITEKILSETVINEQGGASDSVEKFADKESLAVYMKSMIDLHIQNVDNILSVIYNNGVENNE